MAPRLGRYAYLAFCAAVFFFLVAPILVIVPLSFNAEPYFTFTEGCSGSTRTRTRCAGTGRSSRTSVDGQPCEQPRDRGQRHPGRHVLGTLAALGLASPGVPARRVMMGILISPMVTPVIISAAGMFFFYSNLGLGQTHLGIILAHATLGVPSWSSR